MPGVPIYNDRIKPSLAHFGVINGHIELNIYLISFALARCAVHRKPGKTLDNSVQCNGDVSAPIWPNVEVSRKYLLVAN
jgi:hypothetical protein